MAKTPPAMMARFMVASPAEAANSVPRRGGSISHRAATDYARVTNFAISVDRFEATASHGGAVGTGPLACGTIRPMQAERVQVELWRRTSPGLWNAAA